MIGSVSNNFYKGFCKWLTQIEYLHLTVMAIYRKVSTVYVLMILRKDLHGQKSEKSFSKDLPKLR